MWTGAFRNDIQGLRAIGLVLVLATHAAVPGVEGGFVGLDMFYVLSGFLITGLLVTELDRSGTINVAKFYARRVKRIVPMAILVLLVTAITAQVVLSPVRNELVSGDIAAAAAHFVNWRFAAQSVDYFAPETILSPVQHYWSLSVEEQFYAIWPALLLAATLWFRRSGRNYRPALYVAIAIPGIVSLAYSIWYTTRAPDPAYFSTLTRAWELAFGGMLALMPRPNVSARFGAALTLGGLAAIAYGALRFDSTTLFPGTVALIPTLGTAAVIVAGSSPQGLSSAGRVISSRPFSHLGDISYGFYLWHWPLLAFAAEAWGPQSLRQRLLIGVGVAWVLTEISHYLVEQPFRNSRWFLRPPRRGLGLWAGSATAAIAAAFILLWIQPSIPTAPPSAVAGAAVVDKGGEVETRASAIRPEPTSAGSDRGPLPDDGCFPPKGESEHPECAYGDPESKVTVILFGDSKANQLFPAFEFLAKRHGWRLIGLAKPGCGPVSLEVGGEGDDPDCEEWREKAYERIEAEEPTLVAIAANRPERFYRDDGPESQAFERDGAESYVAALRRIRDTDARVAVMKDLPQAPFDVAECVSESPDELNRCWFPVPEHHRDTFADRAAGAVGGAYLVDLTSVVCPEDVCRGVIGKALVYRDRGHLTATFSLTTAPMIERQLPRMG